jgi:Ca2+-binding RTX toxin-like protein
VQVSGAATIAAGAGADVVAVGGGLVVRGLLTVAVGAGDDEVSIVGRVVPQAGMVVELGTGSDQLRTERSERRGNVAAQDAAIHTAGDVVIAKGAGRVEAIIDLPGEGTIGRDLVVQSVAAASSVLVRNADVVRHLSVVTGQGVDHVSVVQSHVGENLFLATSAGRDTVALTTVQVVGDTRIEAGAGNDTVELRHVNARTRLFALMGAGDDALTLVNVLLSAAPGDVSLAGGRRGRDSLRLEILRGNGHPSHADFETVTSA